MNKWKWHNTLTMYLAIFLSVLPTLVVATHASDGMGNDAPSLRFIPRLPELTYSPWRTGPVEVAKVFGRWPGCTNTDYEFITEVSNEAVRAGIEPRVFAATVAVESHCDQFAVSMRGAIGLMQVMPRVWKEHYNFTDRYNLFNTRDNLRVGASILADLIQQYGVAEGLHHYQGMGRNCETCDLGYSNRILHLAGR
jgi:Transglycosylase SLT domain